MGALLGLQLMPRNEGRGSQIWGGRGEKENVWNTSGELGKVGERQMCFQEKRREEKLCFRMLSPTSNPSQDGFIEEYSAKCTLETKTHS